MRKGGKPMKHLKTDSGKGFFSVDGKNWTEIDKIGRDDLLSLLDLALADGFEIDPFLVEKINNPAQQIVYRHLADKLANLEQNRSRFRDESENLFKDAIEKYSISEDQK